MEKKCLLITESTYEGSWEPETNVMNGFGTYLYPDCSEYRGYFQNGKFHGFGRLRLAAPHKFTVEGNFVNGVLKDIAHMWFHDGLTASISFDENNKLDFSKWNFCNERDRRYVRELVYGLEPVKPNALITAENKVHHLEKDTFDIEEGIFKEAAGFVNHCLPPFRPTRFVDCEPEKQWIREHCRRAEADLEEPKPAEERAILENGLAVFQDQKGAKINSGRQYFYKLCQQERDETGAECVISDADINCPPMTESSTTSSFFVSSNDEDVGKICREAEQPTGYGSLELRDFLMRRSTLEKERNVFFNNSIASDKH